MQSLVLALHACNDAYSCAKTLRFYTIKWTTEWLDEYTQLMDIFNGDVIDLLVGYRSRSARRAVTLLIVILQ